MNGLAVVITTIVILVLQSTIAPKLAVWGVRPDWLLVLVVFFGLYARREQAIVSAFMVGLCADLLTSERFGLLAGSYGLAAALVVAVREYLFRYRPTTQFAVTLVVAGLVNLSWMVYRRVVYGAVESMAVDLGVQVPLGALYTAAFAPILHGAMLRAGRLMGVRPSRYRFGPMRP